MNNPSGRNGAVRIVTDTTANLPPGYAQARSLEVVPQVIIFGQESLLEAYEISSAEFIRRLKASAQLPKTAAPPPGEFIEAYRRQLAEADTIISIHPSADVSGTVRSAEMAKAEAFPDADIRIIDTRAIGGALGAMVMAAVEWAEDGASADGVVSRTRALILRSRTYFVLRTLEYLQKGGRIGGGRGPGRQPVADQAHPGDQGWARGGPGKGARAASGGGAAEGNGRPAVPS